MASNAPVVSTRRERLRQFGEAVLSDGNEGGMPVRQVVAIVVVLAALLGAGLWITGALRGTATIQDCVAAGRTNCAPIQ